MTAQITNIVILIVIGAIFLAVYPTRASELETVYLPVINGGNVPSYCLPPKTWDSKLKACKKSRLHQTLSNFKSFPGV